MKNAAIILDALVFFGALLLTGCDESDDNNDTQTTTIVPHFSTVIGNHAQPQEETLSIVPYEQTLPIFSSGSDEETHVVAIKASNPNVTCTPKSQVASVGETVTFLCDADIGSLEGDQADTLSYYLDSMLQGSKSVPVSTFDPSFIFSTHLPQNILKSVKYPIVITIMNTNIGLTH